MRQKKIALANERTQNRASKLLKDIGIYAIGNLGSKLVTFLLVPLYTFFILPADYGYYDICFTVIVLLMPFISFQLRDGAFRFLLDAQGEEQRSQVVSYALKVLARNTVVCIGLTGVLAFIYPLRFMWMVAAFAISMSLYEVVIQVVRGLGHTKMFVAIGIICSFLIAALSILFVVVLKMGIAGIFLSNILARLISLLIIEWKIRVYRDYFRGQKVSKDLARQMLKFCLPLMPATICLWLMSSSNRFFIEHFLGLRDNGYFAVVQKFASILETLAFIFYQAWQEMAIRQYESADRDKLFSNIFNSYIYLLSFLVVGISYFIKINYGWIVDANYQASAAYLFPMLVSSMLVSLCFFYDLGYQCSKRTVYALPGVILGAILNLACNYYFVIYFGLYGIIGSLIVTYLFLFFYRMWDTRKFFDIKIDVKTLVPIMLMVLSWVAYYVIESKALLSAFFLIVVLAYIAIMPGNIKEMVRGKIKKIQR